MTDIQWNYAKGFKNGWVAGLLMGMCLLALLWTHLPG